MAAKESSETPKRRGRAQSTPEEREKYLQNLAFDLAEEQLLKKTASSQVITQLMKGGGVREQLELKEKEAQIRLLNARIDGLESAVRMEASIEAALEAFKSYQPSRSDDPDD